MLEQNETSGDVVVKSLFAGMNFYDPVEGATALQDLVEEMAPYQTNTPPQQSWEDDEKFKIRRAADQQMEGVKMLRATATNARTAMAVAIRDFFLTGEYMNTSFVVFNTGESTPVDWLVRIMQECGFEMVLSPWQASILKSMLTVVLPEMALHSYKFDDTMMNALMDENGGVQMGRVARNAVSLCSKYKETGITKEQADMIYAACSGDEDAKKALAAEVVTKDENGKPTEKAPLDKLVAEATIKSDGIEYRVFVPSDNAAYDAIIQRYFDVKPY